MLLSLLALLAVMTARAQQDTLQLGFCNGEVATLSDYQLNGKGWTECALRLSANSLRSYVGNAISGIRAGLAARINTDTLRVWVRREKDGPNLAEGYVVRKGTSGIVKGWNRVEFAAPYHLTADDGDLYVGYSLHQKGNVKAVSVVSPAISNTSFVKLGDGAWTDVSDQGVLSIEALISGDKLPAYDLGLGVSSVTPAPAEGVCALRFTAQVHNYGLHPVKGFTLTVQADGIAPQSVHIAKTIASTADSTVTFVVDPKVATDEKTPWKLSLPALDEGIDGNEANNTSVPDYMFVRNVLIEEFTTEQCSNCPRVAGFLHTLLAQPQYKDRVYAVSHHAGYYTDWLTQPCDEELTWLYNEGNSLYAPAIGYDRQPFFEATYNKGKKSAIHCPNYIDEMQAYLDYELQQTANAMVDVKLAFNSDSTEVTATVGALCTHLYKTSNPRLNIFLLENDVKAKNQSGATGVYMQQHVTRGYNSTWGEPVTWTDNRFTASHTFTLDPAWVKDKMEVVAFLYNYDSEDATNCAVDNTASAKLITDNGTTTGITSAHVGRQPQPVAAYDMAGRKVGFGQPGLKLVKMSDGSVRKMWNK